MKREPDYIIELLNEFEESEEDIVLVLEAIKKTRGGMKKMHHLRLMCDAGLLEEVGEGRNGFRITNSGHDFLEASRNPKVWEEVKGLIKDGLPLVAAISRIASLF